MKTIKKYWGIIVIALLALVGGTALMSSKKKERKIKEAEDRIATRVIEKEKNDVRIEEIIKRKTAVKKDIDAGKKEIEEIKRRPKRKPVKRTPSDAKKNILDKTKR